MYPRNAASPERIAVGAVVQISDGAVQGADVVITVRGQGGAEAGGGGTTAYGATGVVVYYTPTQAETDFTSFTVIASKAGCIPVAVTVVTTASSVPGRTMPADGSVTAAVIADNAIDAATFAADVNAEILSYIVDDATRIDASALNTASVTTIPAILEDTDDIGVAGAGLTEAGGTGDHLTALATQASVNTIDGIVDDILVDTGTTIQAELDGIQADTEDIQSRLPAALTGGGNIKADVLAISGSTDAANNLEESTEAIAYGIVDGTGATTTSFATSALTPDSAVNDQFNGRVLIFKNDTTTANLRGQATTISDWVHTSAEVGTFTVVALTTAPTTGDTFTIL